MACLHTPYNKLLIFLKKGSEAGFLVAVYWLLKHTFVFALLGDDT